MAHTQKILPGDVQIMTQKEIVVLVNASRQRILDGDQARIRSCMNDGFKDHIERLTGLRLHLTEEIEDRLFTVRAGLTLESNFHHGSLSMLTRLTTPLTVSRPTLRFF